MFAFIFIASMCVLISIIFIEHVTNPKRIVDTSTALEDTNQKPLNEPEGQIVEVSGESYKNDDGTSRQDIISMLKSGDPVHFVHDFNNKFDSGAVAVFTIYGQIGYVGKNDGSKKSILKRLKSRLPIHASVLNIVGGTSEKPNKGVWLDVDIDILNEQRRKI